MTSGNPSHLPAPAPSSGRSRWGQSLRKGRRWSLPRTGAAPGREGSRRKWKFSSRSSRMRAQEKSSSRIWTNLLPLVLQEDADMTLVAHRPVGVNLGETKWDKETNIERTNTTKTRHEVHMKKMERIKSRLKSQETQDDLNCCRLTPQGKYVASQLLSDLECFGLRLEVVDGPAVGEVFCSGQNEFEQE